MKYIKPLAIATVHGLAICTFAIAQGHHNGAWIHGASQQFADPGSAAEHLAEVFATVAVFDANKDGQLDATETESFAKALAEGAVTLPAHKTPNGVTPSTDMILHHIAGMYAHVASFDANHDGKFDAIEQAALKSAIEKGDLVCPHGQQPLCLGVPRH